MILSSISRHNRKSFWTSVNSERFAVSDIFNKSSNCLQVQGLKITILWKTRVVLLFKCESLHACQSLVPLVETKTNKKTILRLSLASVFTPPLFLATKVAISFVYCPPKTIKCTQKTKMEKKFTGIDQSRERASAIPHIVSTTHE